MNWHLYKKDDPNTWPEIDCPMLVYDDEIDELYICKWNNDLNKFVDKNKKVIHHWKECYYQYIGYVPNGYKVCKTKKCGVYPETICQYEDDGYCFDLPRHIKCKHIQEVNEYSLNENKRIWKEFEE